ncbi:MAG TPA: porin [Bryobacteraceae bacterium]|nr:porin [Bryobacteraceae bacterium]
MRHYCPVCRIALCLLVAASAWGQTPQPEPPAPPPSAAPVWSAGGIDFSGLVDAYYSLNFNHPATRNNNLRSFDARANQFSLNMAKLSAEHSADPVGFKLETIWGRAADLFHATEPAGIEVYKHVLQAYVSVKPASWKGVQFDFGKFVTSAGAEVTETHLNWNYSRGLLYTNGPFYHFGARLTAPVSKQVTLGYQLVNGWNNVEDNNSGKTHGFTTAVITSKVNWFNNYYVGPEKTNTNKGWRHFYDTVLAVNPNGRINGLFNFDYGQENNPGAKASKFYGWLAAVRLLMGSHCAVSPRYEWYKDQSGLITGQEQTLQEATLTFEYKLRQGFLSRLEYRRDWSSRLFFDRGNEPASARNQDTLLAGLVVYFGPK